MLGAALAIALQGPAIEPRGGADGIAGQPQRAELAGLLLVRAGSGEQQRAPGRQAGELAADGGR